MKANITLDTIGLYCPVPVMLATEKMEVLGAGDVLEILADDPEAIEDIPHWSKTTGNKFLKVEKDGDVYRFYIKKGVQGSRFTVHGSRLILQTVNGEP